MQEQSSQIVKTGNYYEQGHPWIYRGQSFSRWSIKSSFERFIGKDRWANEADDSIKRVEDASLAYFKQHAKLIGIQAPIDDLEWLCYMQHYGCPTRLVDFTTVPLVAFYHAIYGLDARLDFSVYAVSRDHVLGVEYWKDEYQDAPERVSDCSEDRHYDVANARKIANWLISPRTNNKPDDDTDAQIICVHPEFENSRIEAQSGLFLMQRTLRGSFEDDLASMVGIDDGKDDSIDLKEFERQIREETFYDSIWCVKFEFGWNLRTEAKMLLQASGVTHRTMCPDFQGLAKDVGEMIFARGERGKIFEKKLQAPHFNLPMTLPTVGGNVQ